MTNGFSGACAALRVSAPLLCLLLLNAPSRGFANGPETPPPVKKAAVAQALEEEMRRAKETLTQKGPQPPYFISYQVTDSDLVSISAKYGALQNSDARRIRLLDVDVRVGDYEFDNTHQIRGFGGFNSPRSIPIPLEDDLDALKSSIWLETDRRYKSALERLIQVKANRAVKVEEEDKSADFTRETPQTAALPSVKPAVNAAEWEARVKRLSSFFKGNPDILESSVSFYADASNKFLVTSEGTSLQQGTTEIRLAIIAQTRAADGMDLYRYEIFAARTPDRLPDEAAVTRVMEKMAADLKALKAAPVVEPYTGPAILSGRASGVFFHEIFGHRIEGQRQKGDDEGQTFTKKINQPVLPEFISVYDDPTMDRLGDVELNGFYRYDDEGVKSQRVPVVERGVLRNFLMSRLPIQGFDRSNGHGRKAPGYRAAGRQGNLIVESSKTVSEAKLREMLIEECKRQGKPFGLIFQDISGGFTLTTRNSPQAFQVTPIMVYRIYTDGRPDELVRGVDLVGTPLISFSKIIACGDRTEVFNGMCGAESGFVPVSAVSPSILTAQIEIQKKPKSSDRLPALPPPDVK
jgi:TldD protein